MSLAVAEAVRARQWPTIAVNDTFRLAPWADMLYAADTGWWRCHAQDALKFAGLKVTANSSCEFRDVLLLNQTGYEGFDPNPKNIRTGGNSGYQALHIAIHAGAARVALFGFDMGGAHWFGKHKHPLRNTDPDTFKRWIKRFPGLMGHGAEIVNCTPGSALECFPMARIEDL